MEKRILGIILSVVGMIGLIAAGIIFMNRSATATDFKQIAMYGILGAIFFFAGIGLIRNTNDKAA
jgi:uncharacterized membrane protein